MRLMRRGDGPMAKCRAGRDDAAAMEIVRSLWSRPDFFLWVAIACLLIFGVAQTAAQHHEQRSVHVESGPRRSVWHFVEQSAAIVGITSFLSQVAMWIYFWPS